MGMLLRRFHLEGLRREYPRQLPHILDSLSPSLSISLSSIVHGEDLSVYGYDLQDQTFLSLSLLQVCDDFVSTFLRQRGESVPASLQEETDRAFSPGPSSAAGGGSTGSGGGGGSGLGPALTEQLRKMDFGTWLELVLQVCAPIVLSGLMAFVLDF